MNARTPSVPASGILSSVGASVIFGIIFMIPPYLLPLDPEQILGYRIIAMVTFLAAFFCSARMWDQAAALVGRLRAAPHLVGVLVVDAALLGLQLWLFGWAPQSGHGLDLSLGYLILPVVMVVVSVAVYREKLSRWQIAAVLCAAAGVTAAVVVAGGLRWPTLLVALGLPLYFISRRAFALDSAAAQLFELSAMLPFSVFVLAAKPSLGTVIHRPQLIAGLVLLGLLSAAGFALYLTASRVLPFFLFGVLSYVEPVLLVLVSLTLLGEPWQSADTFVYIPICAGLVLLALESAAEESAAPKQPAPQVDSARP
ncbi:EamA family transporter RarD [Streptomyces sp. NPDC058667]|uniref:EamA family transporter RarD n=1 Tax=Streptomyces sp. NPDC058667 TaxID=3346588 RepID=UPI0036474BE4